METLGPPPAWMMAAAKRTSAFFKKVPSTAANGSSGNGVDAGDGSRYVLYSKEEFEAANNCQVKPCARGPVGDLVLLEPLTRGDGCLCSSRACFDDVML